MMYEDTAPKHPELVKEDITSDVDEAALKYAEALKAYCQSRKGDHCSNCLFGNRVCQGSGYFWRCRLYDMPGFWKLGEELSQVCEDSQQTE